MSTCLIIPVANDEEEQDVALTVNSFRRLVPNVTVIFGVDEDYANSWLSCPVTPHASAPNHLFIFVGTSPHLRGITVQFSHGAGNPCAHSYLAHGATTTLPRQNLSVLLPSAG